LSKEPIQITKIRHVSWYACDISSDLFYRRRQLRFTARPVMKTYAPSFTNCFAVARPIPLLPPVMSAIFPSSVPMSFSFGSHL
jgi:hypothetical protein